MGNTLRGPAQCAHYSFSIPGAKRMNVHNPHGLVSLQVFADLISENICTPQSYSWRATTRFGVPGHERAVENRQRPLRLRIGVSDHSNRVKAERVCEDKGTSGCKAR